MSEPSDKFQFGGLLCFPQERDPDAYLYVPLRADIERGASGKASLNLLQSGTTGYLMLTAVWRANDETIDALRQEIAARTGNPDPEKIKLSPSPVNVSRCDLLLGDGAGNFQTLASSSTSRMPPFSALFSTSLSAEQFAGVAAAVNGRAGFLAVEYVASVPTQSVATARLLPQSTNFVRWLREAGGEDEQSFRSALEEAIQDKLAIVSVDLPDNPSTTLIANLYERLIARAATVLSRLIGSRADDDIESLEIEVELVEQAHQALRPRVDLASVMLDPSQIVIAPERSSERGDESRRPLRISLGFDPSGAPLAWVRVRGGDSEVVLLSPQFRAVELGSDWQANPLTITAGFNNGVQNHIENIRPPAWPELFLSPEQLGLRDLSVDGTPLMAAGMQRAEISLRYRPPHRPDDQRATLTLRDGAWKSRWWVVTRTASWLRYVEFSWKAIAPDGRVVSASTEVGHDPKIVLSVNGGSSHAAD